jgi:hypothetical protein
MATVALQLFIFRYRSGRLTGEYVKRTPTTNVIDQYVAGLLNNPIMSNEQLSATTVLDCKTSVFINSFITAQYH